MIANCTVRQQHAAGSLTLNMKEVLCDPVNTLKRAMTLHIVVPRFVVIVLREIIVVFPVFKEVQISAATFTASTYVMEITPVDYGNICIRHYALVCTISSDEDLRVWKRCAVTRVSFLVAALIH